MYVCVCMHAARQRVGLVLPNSASSSPHSPDTSKLDEERGKQKKKELHNRGYSAQHTATQARKPHGPAFRRRLVVAADDAAD